MTISIIIPTYNQQDTLEETLNSALSQTVPSEIIVVNDGSTDNTRFILSEYEEKVKVIHQTNRGLPTARNTGIMNATGDYVLPLDSDDVLEPNCVERLLQVAEDTGADVIAPSFRTFGTTSESVMLQMRPTLDDLKTGNRLGYCAAIRRSALLEVGGYSPRMVWGWEDLHLTITLLSRGKSLVTVPEFLWKYRTKEFSMIFVANQHSEELKCQISKDFPAFYD